VIDANRLSGLLSDYDISLSSEQYRQLDIYAQMLVDWNERMNLTAITDPAEMEIKHFLTLRFVTGFINVCHLG